MVPFFYFFLTCIVLLFSWSFFFKTRSFWNLPPGPFSFPIIGNLHQMRQPLHRTFHALSQKHGKVFSLWFGSRFVVVVSSPEAVQECFTKNDIVLANRPRLLTGKYIGYNYTTVAVSPYGDHWRNLSRIVSLEVHSTHRLNCFSEIRRDEVTRLVRKLAHDSRSGFAKVELKSSFSEMTVNIIMRMVSGKRYYGEDCDVCDVEEARQFRGIIKELVAVGGANNPGDFLPLLRWFNFDDLEKNLNRTSKITDAFLQGFTDEHRNRKQSVNTMIDHLLTQQQSQPEYYTDEIIKGLVLNLQPFPLHCTARALLGFVSHLEPVRLKAQVVIPTPLLQVHHSSYCAPRFRVEVLLAFFQMDEVPAVNKEMAIPLLSHRGWILYFFSSCFSLGLQPMYCYALLPFSLLSDFYLVFPWHRGVLGL
ncbi:cytochrome P450 81E8-like isoform X2 [Vigna unguiculata]|uniref:cytochrome P450 81E8-like isoform X2 n=1 Tax=Vigna unguiculata TaxID=3917 RepID=UPI001016D036|nr:cytochrome P450 81E8-like isoform X2 [Vigna unguiculata]